MHMLVARRGRRGCWRWSDSTRAPCRPQCRQEPRRQARGTGGGGGGELTPGGAGIIKSIADRVAGLRAGRKSIPEERVAILYNDASSFTVSTSESADKYARDLGLVPVVRAYNGTDYPPGRILPLLREARAQGIRWLLVMALDPDGLDAARAMRDGGIEADVKWITIAPGGNFFLPRMGARGAEFFMVRRGARGGGGRVTVARPA